MMPACRIPPPNILRNRRARWMNSRVPASAEPTGAPETLGKAHAHRIEVRRVVALRDAGGDRRIPQPRAVEVHAQAVPARHGRDLPDASPSARCCRRRDCGCSPRRPVCVGAKCWSGGRSAASTSAAVKMPRTPGRQRHITPESAAGAPRFVVVNVGVGIDEDLVARFGVGADARVGWPWCPRA